MSLCRKKCCLFKSFNGWGIDRNIRGYNGQNSTESLCCGFLVLESRCRGFSVLEFRWYWDIEFLQNSDPYAPWYHNVVKIFHHSRLFFVLYLLTDTHVYICQSLLSALCRIKVFKNIFTLWFYSYTIETTTNLFIYFNFNFCWHHTIQIKWHIMYK